MVGWVLARQVVRPGAGAREQHDETAARRCAWHACPLQDSASSGRTVGPSCAPPPPTRHQMTQPIRTTVVATPCLARSGPRSPCPPPCLRGRPVHPPPPPTRQLVGRGGEVGCRRPLPAALPARQLLPRDGGVAVARQVDAHETVVHVPGHEGANLDQDKEGRARTGFPAAAGTKGQQSRRPPPHPGKLGSHVEVPGTEYRVRAHYVQVSTCVCAIGQGEKHHCCHRRGRGADPALLITTWPSTLPLPMPRVHPRAPPPPSPWPRPRIPR